MDFSDVKKLRKEVENEYIAKGYSEEQLNKSLHKDNRYPKDRLIEVTGYDLENNKILGLINNKKCEVSIFQSSFNRVEDMLTNNIDLGIIKKENSWYGHKIDINMEKNIPLKSKIIIEQSVIVNTNDSIISFVANRIIHLAPDNDKSFVDMFLRKDVKMVNKSDVAQKIVQFRNKSVDITSNKPQ